MRRVVHGDGHDASLFTSREKVVRIVRFEFSSERFQVGRPIEAVFALARTAGAQVHEQLLVRDAEQKILERGTTFEMMGGFEARDEGELDQVVHVARASSPKEGVEGGSASSNELVAGVAVASTPIVRQRALRRRRGQRGIHVKRSPTP